MLRDVHTPRQPEDERPTRDARAHPVSVRLMMFAIALYVYARLWRLTASCLWFDEIFGVHAARLSWSAMLDFVAADLIHPPLFYALLKVWIATDGESLTWLRLLPALASFACLAPFLLLCRELRLSHRETTLALLLTAASGYLIKYAQEVRMYSLLLLLTLTSLWLFARFVTRCDDDEGAKSLRRHLLLLALFMVNLLLVYTHYYGWLVVVTEAVYLLLFARRGLRSFALVACALVACFAPWVYAVWQAAGGSGAASLQQNLGWAARPGLLDPALFLLLVNEPFYFRQSSAESASSLLSVPLALFVFGAPLLALLWHTLSSKRRASSSEATTQTDSEAQADSRRFDGHERTIVWLLVFTLLPLAAAFVASHLLPQSVWGTRHLVVVAAPYLMLSAVALTRLRPAWLRTTAHVALGLWFFVAALVVVARKEAPYVWCAWEQLAAELVREEPASNEARVRVYALEDLVAYHLWFAFEKARERRFEVVVVKRLPGTTEDPAYFLPRRFEGVAVRDASAAFDESQFWIAFRDAELSTQREPLKTLTQRGFRLAQIRESGVAGQQQRAFLILVRRD
ncbi:MAG TPA: glycosyltransferase family 39 protein [Pyrinomonadaceae bacterium]|nr:glycosyltransferase family 39 protein [Pyrinomonadaceae bacterium]